MATTSRRTPALVHILPVRRGWGLLRFELPSIIVVTAITPSYTSLRCRSHAPDGL